MCINLVLEKTDHYDTVKVKYTLPGQFIKKKNTHEPVTWLSAFKHLNI